MATASLFERLSKRVIAFYLFAIVAISLLEILLQMWQTYVLLAVLSVLACLRLRRFKTTGTARSRGGDERTPHKPALSSFNGPGD